MKHNSLAPLRSIPPMRRTLSAIFIVFSIVTAFAAFGVPVGTSWTYQGQLQRNGAAYNGNCNFQFSLWDAATSGTQVASPQSINGVNVVNGLFTVEIDFRGLGSGGYPGPTGEALWLGTSVQCTGDGGFTPLDPRQPITATPYAASLVPAASIIGPPLGTPVGLAGTLNVHNTEQHGYGVYGTSAGDIDSAGVFGSSSGPGPGIYGRNTNIGGGLAGRFDGPVDVSGPLTVNIPVQGTGSVARRAVWEKVTKVCPKPTG